MTTELMSNYFFSTRQVAKIFGLRPNTLQRAIWDGRVRSPAKSPAGDFLWTVDDIESVAWELGRHREFVEWKERIDDK